jgi:hypothetical protein
VYDKNGYVKGSFSWNNKNKIKNTYFLIFV